MIRQAVSSDRAPAALGAYSQAMVAGGFVFCSGTAGIDPSTGAIAQGVEAQTEQALLNLGAVLAGRRGQDDDLLRRRQRLRPARRDLRPAHARPAAGPLRAGQCAATARPARLDRRDCGTAERRIVIRALGAGKR